MRLMRPDTTDSVQKDLRKRIKDDSIAITMLSGGNPSTFSRTDTEGYERLCNAIRATWPKAIISPYLMIAASDSRHFHRISDVVLRFSAMELNNEDRKRIHGHDERIREGQFIEALAFYQRMLRAS
jgi:carboxypeptidase PM20D1